MKLISGLVTIAIAADGTKKVPPRNPLQRLATLTEFFINYADEVIAPLKAANPSLRVNPEKFVARMVALTGRMERAYNRPTCGYFDPSTTHGGPDPNPGHRENGNPRNRRQAEGEGEAVTSEDLDNNAVVEAECVGAVFTEISFQSDCCKLQTGTFYADNKDECDKLPRAGKGGKGKKTHWERLSNDPFLKFKQMMTGTRKWADRYIGNCSGQRKNNIIKNKTKSLLINMMAKLELNQ